LKSKCDPSLAADKGSSPLQVRSYARGPHAHTTCHDMNGTDLSPAINCTFTTNCLICYMIWKTL
jgi:hypothetical protein